MWMHVIGAAREGQWACQCRCMQRPELGAGQVNTWEGQADSMHGTAGTCTCQACSAPVSAAAFRGLCGAVGMGLHIPAVTRKAVGMGVLLPSDAKKVIDVM